MTSLLASAPDISPRDSPLARLGYDPRRAVGEEAIVCLICGRPLRQITNSHLRAHGTTTSAYKQRFGYNARRPLMANVLRRLYAERSVRLGLAGLIRERPIVARPELRSLGGRRALAWEEILTRSDARRRQAVRREAERRATRRTATGALFSAGRPVSASAEG